MDLELAGRRALLTGGSRGLGRQIALGLARHGMRVLAAARTPGDDDLRQALEARGGYTAELDVTDESAVAAMAAEIQERWGGLDLLVNGAAVIVRRPLGETSLDDWSRVIGTNLTGTYLVTRTMLPLLGSGSVIVNLASGAALAGMAERAAYVSSKAGLLGFTRSLAREVGPRGVRVNAILPGVVEAETISDEQRQRYSRMSAMGRLTDPQEVADVVAFLASDLARFVSGGLIRVDGGI